MFKYSPTFVFNKLTIQDSNIPILFLAKDEDIPRLIFKMFSLEKTKDDLANDANKMQQFFGCAVRGRTILDQMNEEEWSKLRYSVSTQDSA